MIRGHVDIEVAVKIGRCSDRCSLKVNGQSEQWRPLAVGNSSWKFLLQNLCSIFFTREFGVKQISYCLYDVCGFLLFGKREDSFSCP